MPLKPINPLTHPNFDALVEAAPHATVFHTAGWARVLKEAYNYTPAYFADMDDTKISTLWPIMEVDSRLTGKRGVCLPFTDFCAPITNGRPSFQDGFDCLRANGTARGWKRIEIRGGQPDLKDAPNAASYYIHTLPLGKSEPELMADFRESTRRNIRKAQKSGVTVTFDTAGESLRTFYRLNCITRKRHGLPPQPFSFFEKLREHILGKGNGLTVTAHHGGRPIAAAVFLHFRDTALYKYGASDPAHQHLRSNNLVMWEAIRHYNAHGVKSFHFGRTEPDNPGLLQFKRGWGTAEEMIHYYTYDLQKETFVPGSGHPRAFHGLFRKLPIPLLRLAGTLLYRHVG